MAIIRFILGKVILFFNWLFPPRGIARDTETQASVDKQTASLQLYHYKACPFCVKVRRAMKRQALNIETKDVKRSASAREELLAGGGDLKVPCLRVEQENGKVDWMYESSEIIDYLTQRFTATATA